MGEPDGLTELVTAAAEGDPRAWNTIVERFAPLLWARARSFRLNQEDAADVVQNTWLKLLDHLHHIEEPEALAGWLATTARHEALALLRRRSREQPARQEDLGERAGDPEATDLDAALLADERDAQLWRCYRQLPEACQQLLRVLMACDRPSYAAVSEALDMPIGSIGPSRMRCLDKLRHYVDESGYSFREENLP